MPSTAVANTTAALLNTVASAGKSPSPTTGATSANGNATGAKGNTPKTAASTSTPKAPENNGSGNEQDNGGGITTNFAALLLSHLGNAKTGKAQETTQTTPGTTDKSEVPSADTGKTDDNSALLAALGLVNGQLPPAQTPQPQAPTTNGAAELGAETPLAGSGQPQTNPLLTAAQEKAAKTAVLTQDTGGKETANLADFQDKLLAATEENGNKGDPAATAINLNAPAPTGTNDGAKVADKNLQVQTPVNNPNWGNEVSQKVVWLAGQDKQTAQLTLNPPHLGPLEVTLNIHGDQANAVFVSPHAEVRDALEKALPQLRDMMQDAGVQLGQANVSSESSRQAWNDGAASQGSSSGRSSSGFSGGMGDDGEVAPLPSRSLRSNLGLVDTFA